MSDLKGKIDFTLFLSVENANPNGDPLNGKDVYKRQHIDRAKADSLKIMDSIAEMINRDKPSVYGSGNFYLGMYERLLISLLIDSDWSDTASFFEQKGLPRRLSKEETQHICCLLYTSRCV